VEGLFTLHLDSQWPSPLSIVRITVRGLIPHCPQEKHFHLPPRGDS
jgi:hypothetical protein